MTCKAGYDRNGRHEGGGSKPVMAPVKKVGKQARVKAGMKKG